MTLREPAEAGNVRVGAAVNDVVFASGDPAYREHVSGDRRPELRRGQVTFWGASDAHTRVDGHFGEDRSPLLFDRAGEAEPAHDAVPAAFAARAKRTPTGDPP